jgi:hypothetical protein
VAATDAAKVHIRERQCLALPSNLVLESPMRNKKNRRTSTAAEEHDKQHDLTSKERRQLNDRRKENMSMEERQLQFSEMPSVDLPKEK